MKKKYVLDTNVLLSDPNALFSFEDNDVVVPLIVIEELDRHKDRQDEVGRNARETSRKLSFLTKSNKEITKGIPLGSNLGNLYILSIDDITADVSVPRELNEKYGDNIILTFCKSYIANNPNEYVCLVSRDVLLRIKSEVVGVNSEDYKKFNVQAYSSNNKQIYSGVKKEFLSEFQVDKLYSEDGLVLSQEEIEQNQINPNEFLVLKDSFGRSGLAKFCSELKPLKRVSENRSAWNVRARNKEQAFALELLFDDNIKLVTLCGAAGTGKNLLSIAAGLEQVLGSNKKYNKLIITRPIQPLGKDIGALPGSLEEKMEPWIGGFKDNLEYLLSEDVNLAKEKGATISKKKNGNTSVLKSLMLQEYMDKGIIEIEAMTFIRGRSIPKSFIIFDEIQNIGIHEIKTIITRVGEGSKLILLGDINQIDNPYVDWSNNGLSIVVEKFKGEEIAGHVTLEKGERSELATIASKILE